jgi:hypothetical protein
MEGSGRSKSMPAEKLWSRGRGEAAAVERLIKVVGDSRLPE